MRNTDKTERRAAWQKFSLRAAVSGISRNNLLLAFAAAVLVAYWGFGEAGLLAIVGLCPVILLLSGGVSRTQPADDARDAITGLPLRSRLLQVADTHIRTSPVQGRSTACLALELDDFSELTTRLGTERADEILRQAAARMLSLLRSSDTLSRTARAQFGLILSPIRRVDLESMIQLAARLHEVIEEPFRIGGESIYISACTGFCLLNRSPADTADSLVGAAEKALLSARQQGHGSIRAFTNEMRDIEISDKELRDAIDLALTNGEIRPWFQPQISTDSGKITGVEALARWVHPTRGVIPPADFLPAIHESGLSKRLGEVILYNSLKSLKSLERAGTYIPVVGVNFSETELRDPELVDRIRWELDRFDIAPSRLGIEILENVFADHDDDVISRNIRSLADLGCQIDLDDFGTGHASISSIRRFAVGRLKIDRSFITRVDLDQDQQRMVSAILTMAEQLQLETLAEGVETAGEHAILAQLGCGYVQGYGVARPMPAEDLPVWINNHQVKLDAALRIGRKIG